MQDKNGREYARLSQLKAGDRIEADNGFTCLGAGVHLVMENKTGLFVHCTRGMHYLFGQAAASDPDALVGFYPVADPLVTKSDPIE